MWIRCMLVLLLSLVGLVVDVGATQAARPRRFIYNSDGNNMFVHMKPPMRAEDVYRYVDEIASGDVTTLYMCPNWGMLVNYPSKVTPMFGTGLNAEQEKLLAEAAEKTYWGRGAANLKSLVAAGHDPLALVIDRARARGLETFITFRPNEVHGVDRPNKFPTMLLLSQFWRKHPQWRIGKVGDPLSPLYRDILGPRTSPVVARWLPGG